MSFLNSRAAVSVVVDTDLMWIEADGISKKITWEKIRNKIFSDSIAIDVPADAISIDSFGSVKIGANDYDSNLNVTGSGRFGDTALSLVSIGSALIAGQKGLQVKYDLGDDVAAIQAIEQGVSVKDIALNPSGGRIGICTIAPTTTLDLNGSFKITATTITTGTYNNFDVTGIGDITVDTSSGHIALNGFANGVEGQKITVSKRISANTVALNHNNASGTQKIFNQSGANYTSGSYTRIDLKFVGGGWVSNAH